MTLREVLDAVRLAPAPQNELTALTTIVDQNRGIAVALLRIAQALQVNTEADG